MHRRMQLHRGMQTANRGFTLVELTVSVSLFMVVMGFMAEVLVSYFAALETTHQRTEAMQNAVGVLNEMRAYRDETPGEFPHALIAAWPQGLIITGETDTPEAYRLTTLPDETLTIAYVDEDGDRLDATNIAGQHALRVQITSRWRTLHGGRWAEASVQTVLAGS